MSSNYDTESRLRAIAMNAVREALVVEGRFDKPFTDDDAARVETIFGLLHLQKLESIEYEPHQPLTVAKQPPISAALPKIADILGHAETTSRIEPRPALSIAKNKTAELA